jgi:hypothetical protein
MILLPHDVRIFYGVKAGVPRRTALRREIVIDENPFPAGLFDAFADGLPIFRESLNHRADEHSGTRHRHDLPPAPAINDAYRNRLDRLSTNLFSALHRS